jgi:hypothetical protein
VRSDLVFGAMANVSNPYLLSQLASKAARKLHKSGARMQDTTNDVLLRFSRSTPNGCGQALPQRPVVPFHSNETRRIVPHKSEVAPLPPVRQISNPLWEAARVLGA